MIKESLTNEPDILLRVSKGDEAAFALLFRHYRGFLTSYIYRMTESKIVMEVIVQDVFVKVWIMRADLGEIVSFKDYLFILCRNKTFNAMRSMQVRATRFIPLKEGVDIAAPEDTTRREQEIVPC